MKKQFTLWSLSFAFVIAMAFNAAAQGVARNVSGYTGIECNGPFTTTIKIDGTESVKLDVDAEILDDIKTEVVNGVLKIGFKDGRRNHRNIKRANVYITAKKLSYLGNGGSGNTELTAGAITGEHAKIAVSGSGELKSTVRSGELDVDVSGSGSANINGSARKANIGVSGSGNLNGKGLKTATVEASISGSGGVTIVADQEVSASISGSGGLQYSGNARIINDQHSGSGRVTRMN